MKMTKEECWHHKLPKRKCQHSDPGAFGCDDCILYLHEKSFYDWFFHPKTKIPRCGECNEFMMLISHSPRWTEVEFSCQESDQHGEPICEKEDALRTFKIEDITEALCSREKN